MIPVLRSASMKEREEVAAVEIVCVAGRTKCAGMPACGERDPTEMSRRKALVSRMDTEEKVA